MLSRVIPQTKKKSHPAKRTFQALRIEVNDELGVLRTALPAALEALHIGEWPSSSPTSHWRTRS